MIASDIVRLTRELRNLGSHVTIETAGTVYAPVICDLMSISPKLTNSVPVERENGRWAAQHDRLRYQPEVLKSLMHDYEYQLKFVVSAPDDLTEIDEIQRTLRAEPGRIILMPEGIDRDLLRNRGLWLAEICKRSGYRYSPRLHIDLWGDKRGV
jgi:7-carboxy-7-deazaguanine synthase